MIITEIIDESVETALEAWKIGDRLEAVSKDLSLIVIQILHSCEKLGYKRPKENRKICRAHIVDSGSYFLL